MERVGKLAGSLLVAIAIAAGLTVTLLLVTRSGNASGGEAAREDRAQRDAREDDPGHPQRADALLAERRAAWALHLHDGVLPLALEAARGRAAA